MGSEAEREYFVFCIGAGIGDGVGHGVREGIDDSGMFYFRKIEMMMETRLSNQRTQRTGR